MPHGHASSFIFYTTGPKGQRKAEGRELSNLTATAEGKKTHQLIGTKSLVWFGLETNAYQMGQREVRKLLDKTLKVNE